MPDITVHRHGDRWAVKQVGAESPAKGEPELEDPKITAGDPAERSRQPQTGL